MTEKFWCWSMLAVSFGLAVLVLRAVLIAH